MNAQTDRAKEIFLGAVDVARSDDRRAFLDRACGGDAALRGEVEELIARAARAGPLLASGRPDPGETADFHPPSAEGPGSAVGPYKLLEQIGEGGFGVVYMAEQTHPVRRKVAVKVLKPGMDSRQVVARFEAERQALALMDHPNIARVLDGGATPAGRPYFVMELVKGVPITQFCDQNQLPPRRRLELFVQVCRAVQHAHQKGVIHRDIKPSNVLVTMHDTTPVPKVIDFGLAKALGQELTDKTLFTGFAQMIGTPLYMSPEQAGLSGLDVDTRTDVYALGVLLYELLTGTTPFDRGRLRAAGLDEIRRIIREEDPARPSTRLSTRGSVAAAASVNRGSDPGHLSRLVRGELDWIVMKCLEKDRGRRYETANGLAADVERYLAGEAVQAVPPSVGYRLRKFARRNQRALAAVALLCLTLFALAGGLGWVVSDRAARRARVAAEVEQFLQRAESLYADNKLPEAAAEVEKARGVLGTTGDEGLDRRLRQRLAEFETAAKLEEILVESADPGARDRAYAAYSRVFRDYGIDVEALPPEEAAALIAASDIKLDLVLALDRWAAALRADPRALDPAPRQRLQAISRAAHPDPWRLRYNAASEAMDLPALRELADGADLCRLRTRELAGLGDSLRKAGDAKASVAFLTTIQRRYPADYSINASLGWSLRSLTPPQWDDATAFRRIAVAVRPQSSIANYYLAYSLHMQGKLDEAMAYYQATIDLDPKHAPAQFCLANILRARGRTGEAIALFRKSSDLLPTDPNPLNSLAWELATCPDPGHRDHRLALALAKKAVELSLRQGDDRDKAGLDRLGNYWNTLGVAHYRAGNMEGAIAALQTSADIGNGGDSVYLCEDWFFLALASWKLDRKGEARRWYDRAVALMNAKHPADEELIRFRAEASELLGVAIEIAPPPRTKE